MKLKIPSVAREETLVAKKTTTQKHPHHPHHPRQTQKISAMELYFLKTREKNVEGEKQTTLTTLTTSPMVLGEIRKVLSEKKCLISPRTRYKAKITISGGFLLWVLM
ncbi:hypothetical protein [Methanoplanus endosymbiosus]|uniref:Uncharacterized protein n=1 Tax=Methanoplanus endosymbiosus TaxID=33865 RepID=A0A9E7PNW1_9EURY|nr:hypothetical protein [Methanoplanus endosymbiosus]UUX93724.1 hypothetical protein L6E24_06315 [Methanoplanus endosymbiosus]